METQTKICNDKDCAHGKDPQPLENFGIRKSSKDGLNPKCKKCITRLQKEYYQARLEANGGKQSKITRKNKAITWDTTEHPDDFLRMMRPMYSYLINSPVKQNGTIRLGKTLGELIMFFDIPQRASMEALLHYLERVDEGYKWKIKPKGFQEFADKVRELLPNGAIKKDPHNSIIYEQMKIFSERMQDIERKVDLLLISLVGEEKSE